VRRPLRCASRWGLSFVPALGSFLSLGGVGRATSIQVDCGAGADLQAAIDAAAVSATLLVRGTCVGNFVIEKSLTLEGPASRATLDGDGTGTTLRIDSGTVRLVRLIVTGGHGDGGGIANSGTLTLRRTIVRGNTVVGIECSDCGGGILSWGPLTLLYSRVIRNRADHGGGIFSLARLTIDHSVVGWNVGSSGGAAGIQASGGPVSITHSKVIANRRGLDAVSVGGGGTIAHSRLARNRVAVALINGDETMRVTHTTISRTNGDGIFSTGRLTIIASTINDNRGSAVRNGGWGTIRRSTISGNTSDLGAGIVNQGTLSIVSTTVVGNTATETGGGIFDMTGATVAGSILAGNSAPRGPDCFVPSFGTGSPQSGGYNVAGADCAFAATGDQVVQDDMASVGIEPLGLNGGATRTMALIATSPAVDSITVGALSVGLGLPLCSSSGMRDQRGVRRPQGPGCDVGAYELVR
jgi:Right handed beta helix region